MNCGKNNTNLSKGSRLFRCVIGLCISCSIIFAGCEKQSNSKQEEQVKQPKETKEAKEEEKTGFLKYLDKAENSTTQVEMKNLKLLLEVHLVELSVANEEKASKILTYMDQNYCDREIDLATLLEAEDVFGKDVQDALSEEEINTEWYKINIKKDQEGSVTNGNYQVTVLLKDE